MREQDPKGFRGVFDKHKFRSWVLEEDPLSLIPCSLTNTPHFFSILSFYEDFLIHRSNLLQETLDLETPSLRKLSHHSMWVLDHLDSTDTL